jgi:hypothetical protein
MRRAFFCSALLVTAAVAMPAAADEADYTGDSEAYCTYARGVANSESSLLFVPQIFFDYGVVNGNDVSTGAGGVTSAPPTQRLTFGARYSLMGVYRGITNQQRAGADCDRYRAASGLARFLVENREQVSPAALDAKLAVLRAALPKAQEIARSLRGAVERARATVEELQATQVRVDELATATLEAETQRAGLPPARASLPSPSALLRQHREADAEVMKYEGRLRMAQAFDVSVRGGYDRFFGLRDDLPLFGVISLTINPAIVYQPFAESDAARARARFVRSENDAVEQKVELLASRLRALLAGERRRLGEVRTLLADVEGRLRTLESIDSDRLRRFREATWFDWVRLKAEHEFLRVHVGELTTALGEDAG